MLDTCEVIAVCLMHRLSVVSLNVFSNFSAFKTHSRRYKDGKNSTKLDIAGGSPGHRLYRSPKGPNATCLTVALSFQNNKLNCHASLKSGAFEIVERNDLQQ